MLATIGDDRGEGPPQTTKELADELGLHPPAAHNIITTLERHELVRRTKMLRYAHGPRKAYYSKVVLITNMGRWTLAEATPILEMLLENPMLEPATPPPKGAKHVIIPSYSNQGDSCTSSVVLLVDPLFVELIEYRQHNLALHQATDPQLLREAFMKPEGLYFAYYTHDQEERVDPPGEITELCRHMQVMDGDDGVVCFVPVLSAELHIGRNNFWFEWPGADLTDGGTETYYTESLELRNMPRLEGAGEMTN